MIAESPDQIATRVWLTLMDTTPAELLSPHALRVRFDKYPDGERRLRMFACDCAEHVLSIYQSRYPDDARIANCIATVRDCLRGEASESALSAARSDAVAAYDAARSAASAAYAAAHAAADAAAHAAAYAAAYAANAAAAAAAAAADAAADAAAHAAAYAAAYTAYTAAAAKTQERLWQVTRLREYLQGALL